MKDPAFVLMLIALFTCQQFYAQKSSSAGTVNIAEHVSVQFPLPPEKVKEPFDGFSLTHKTGRYAAFKSKELSTDSLMPFSTFTDSLPLAYTQCSEVLYSNKTMNNDSVVLYDIIISGFGEEVKGHSKFISYLRFFEYDNNLICLSYTDAYSKPNKSIFSKNKFFRTVVYKPQLKAHKRGIKKTNVLQFARIIGCPAA
jgi:hypothetical protein